MNQQTTNSRMLHLFVFLGLLFALLAAYLTWFELYGKKAVVTNSFNRRLYADEERILRGSVFDRQGVCLAKTEGEGEGRHRVYPFGNLYAHLIGYDSRTYGKTLLEARYNDALMGKGNLELLGKVERLIAGQQEGYGLVLTVDNALQKKARQLMGKKRGAIVALDPATGEVLAMVSTPDFDPNGEALEAAWPELVEDEGSPLLPRALSGLYPPGSTFKILTAAAALRSGQGAFALEDAGKTVIDGKTISNAGGKAYGELTMAKAFEVSSNVYFAELATELGASALIQQAGEAGIGQKLSFDLPMTASRIGTTDMGSTELAATGIGQGRLLVTPMQMALVGAGIANEGTIMKPYLVKAVTDPEGAVLKTVKAEPLMEMSDAATAAAIREMMLQVVQKGTGKKARIPGIQVAGKTGTAQNEKSVQGEGYDHAWFVGFAPAEQPEIAVAVILEYEGKGGGQAAAPIAAALMKAWLQR